MRASIGERRTKKWSFLSDVTLAHVISLRDPEKER